MKLFSKRMFKRTAIGLGLLIGVALVTNGLLAWRAQYRLDHFIAELRASGEPASLADLAPKAIPPDKNAAAVLPRISPQLEAFEKQYSQFYETPLGKEWDRLEGQEKLPTSEQQKAMRSILDAYPEILPALHQAAACKEYASLLDFNLPASKFVDQAFHGNRPTLIRSLTRFVVWKMEILTAEGNSDGAIRLAMQLLQLARLHDNEPLLVNYLVSIAVREAMFDTINDALRRNQVSSEVHAQLEAELARHETLDPLHQALRSERAFAVPYLLEQTGGVPTFLNWPTLNFFLGELSVENQAYDAAKLPVEQLLQQSDPVTKHHKPSIMDETLNRGLVGPAIRGAFLADIRNVVLARCLRILNALEEYRQRTGKEAQSLDQLSLPPGATIDPYSGKPLLLKKIDEGWVVYSVWRNGVDDGGRFNFENGDWGFGPPGYPRP